MPKLHVRVLPTRLPAALAREAVISKGRYAVIAGGMVAGDASTAASFLFDTGRLRTVPLGSMHVAVHDTAGAAAGSVPLVIGGGNAVEQSDVQALAGNEWHVIGHLPQARSDLVAATVGGRMIVLGGYNGFRVAEPDILASRDGRSWSTIGTLPVPVRYAASTVADGDIWLFGGERGGVMQREIQRVDPATGGATVVGRLPAPIGHAVAMTIGDRVLLAGGRAGAGTATDHMWWFDPASHRVVPAGRLPMALTDSAVVHDGHRFFLVGGESPELSARIIEIAAG
ncbi:MAG: Kelch repeat-containing protein [Solirubrobacteraceae bacterium]